LYPWLAAWGGSREMKNKLCLLACVLLPFTAIAQTAPKVVFAGDEVTAEWQTNPAFTANTNWIGAGITPNTFMFDPSNLVVENFQASVINQHPAFVHIMTGFSDSFTVKDSTPLPYVVTYWEANIVQMVAMAKKANIKVILGNVIYTAVEGQDSEVVNFMNVWLDQYGRANNIPVVNYNAAFCQCIGYFASSVFLYLPPYVSNYAITDAGYALLTQLTETAIATYGLTMKGGYLSNVLLANLDTPPEPQANTALVGAVVNFTAQATWSDGVTRPMGNQDYDGLQGIWMSSNPNVMYISQQGQAVALGAGTASISFVSASGIHFSPWTMTVEIPNSFPF
jgi:hypothetical protein